jgi:hypothetical protein
LPKILDSDRVVIAERLGDHNRQDFVLKTLEIDISMSACRDLRDHRSANVESVFEDLAGFRASMEAVPRGCARGLVFYGQ